MDFISGTAAGLNPATYASLSRYRRKLFIDTLGWQLDSPPGEERDQFDRGDTVYVVARNARGAVTGCARLLPTVAPYLLAEVFPQLLGDLPAPCAPEVWELSRFAALDFDSAQTSALPSWSSELAVALLHQTLACAAACGARHLITVSPIGVERLLRRAGFHARRAGPPVMVDGHPLFACWIEVPQAPSHPG